MHNKFVFSGLTGDLAAIKLGHVNGDPIIGLHGWLDNANSFFPLSQVLSEYHWLCPDMPGHGLSSQRPPGCIYHFTDYVADVFYLYRALQLEKANIVAHSMGAGIAIMFAAVFPERVNKLILIDGIGPISGEDKDGLQQLRKSMSFLQTPLKTGPRVYRSWNEVVRRRQVFGKIKKQNAELLLKRGSSQTGAAVLVHSDARLKQASPVYMSEKKILSIMEGLMAETLLVIADQGLIVGRETTRERINSVANMTVQVVHGHHHVHMDEAERVGQIIRKFLINGKI